MTSVSLGYELSSNTEIKFEKGAEYGILMRGNMFVWGLIAVVRCAVN